MFMTCAINFNNSEMSLSGSLGQYLKAAQQLELLVQLQHLIMFLVHSTKFSPKNLTVG